MKRNTESGAALVGSKDFQKLLVDHVLYKSHQAISGDKHLVLAILDE